MGENRGHKMSALIVRLKNINISLSYDTLTVYPTMQKTVAINAGAKLPAAIKYQETPEYQRYSHSGHLIKMIQNGTAFDRFVYQNEDDHKIYHLNKLNLDAEHVHLKFRSKMTKNIIIDILNAFITNNVITDAEKTQALEEYDTHFRGEREKFTTLLTGLDQSDDTDAIIKWISTCRANEVLTDIHDYLTETKFDYLREYSNSSQWQGSDRNQKIVPTSKQWARIEKAFALQMQRNIYEIANFTANVGKNRAAQFSSGHSFFAIKRKTKSGVNTESKNYHLFSDAKASLLQDSYIKHFKK